MAPILAVFGFDALAFSVPLLLTPPVWLAREDRRTAEPCSGSWRAIRRRPGAWVAVGGNKLPIGDAFESSVYEKGEASPGLTTVARSA